MEEYKRNNENKERFADYLIRKGVLSPKMLQELKNELLKKESNSWQINSYQNRNDNNNENSDSNSKSKHQLTRRTKKRK